MSVKITPYHDALTKKFKAEQTRLVKILPSHVTIEHVGSTALGIGGKNIIDILLGVSDADEMRSVRDLLTKHGYIEGHDSHPDRIFMATSTGETKEGDYHVHICPQGADSYRDIIIFRDFLRDHPEIAKEYEEKKHEVARAAGYDRKKYKALKSEYVTELLARIKAQ